MRLFHSSNGGHEFVYKNGSSDMVSIHEYSRSFLMVD